MGFEFEILHFNIFTISLFIVFASTIHPSGGAAPDVNLNTLRFVHAVWRHGDRSPEAYWPTDTVNTEDSWPQGWGELSIAGMQQQYALGQYLRYRYDGFISSQYDKYQVYIRSTSYNRTIMSAQANLAGMFPPNKNQTWNKQIPWQPVPVHTVEKQSDPFLADCPNYDSEHQRSRSFPEVIAIDNKNADFYKMLTDKSGLLISSFQDFWNIWDPIRCVTAHSGPNDPAGPHSLPDWVTEDVKSRVKPLYDLSFKYRTATEIMKQIRAGPIIREITERMEQRREMNETASRLRYFAYSAHDTSVASVLRSLDAYGDSPSPPYFSAVMIELHELSHRQWVIKLFFRNVTAAEKDSRDPPIELQIGGCGTPCTLESFRKRSEFLFVDDWPTVCGKRSWVMAHGNTIIASLLSAIAVLLVFLVIALLVLAKRMRSNGMPRLAHDTVAYTPVVNANTTDDEE